MLHRVIIHDVQMLTHGPIVQLNQTLNTAKNTVLLQYYMYRCVDSMQQQQKREKRYNLRFKKLP